MRSTKKTAILYFFCYYFTLTMNSARAFHHYGMKRRTSITRHLGHHRLCSGPLSFRYDGTKIRCSSSSTDSSSSTITNVQQDATTDHDNPSPSLTDNTFRIFYNDVYEVPLPPNHRFPMNKYRLVRERVQGSILATKPNVDVDFVVSPLATVEELLTTHDADYIERFLQGQQTEAEQRNVGFPWSPEGVDRSLSSVGGTLAAARHVCDIEMERKAFANTTTSTNLPPPAWAAHIAGGTHHAFFDYGEGFSVFSDMAVAANVVLEEHNNVNNILLLDLDVHQGNGNAVLFKQHSDLDIELPIGCNDSTYLMTLNHWLSKEFLPRHKNGEFPIDLVIYQAGVDILEADRLGRMSLTPEGVQRRNQLVYQFVDALRVPLVICMGGGYPKRNEMEGWDEILDAHASVYLQAYEHLQNR